ITHDGEGGVSAVSAAVVLTDIPPGPNGGSFSAVSPQQFSVEFRLDETSDSGRSGNPGYLPGLPVLAGRLESSGE
ncbi:unnamed protein product, partial [Ectocarpus sp. 13 AM-2016]